MISPAALARLPLATRTDLDVLDALGRCELQVRADHVVVRCPDQPDFHWGNCVHVLDPELVGDAARWVGVFRQEFPHADWVALGLPTAPAETSAYAQLGLEVSVEEALTLTSTAERPSPAQTPTPAGYEVRAVTAEDVEELVARDLADNVRRGRYDPVAHERFVRNLWQVRVRAIAAETAQFFAAYPAGSRDAVSRLGIVLREDRARYQAVVTEPEHRRRGLAAHVLGVAGAWAYERGARQFVIVTEASNPAGRVYRRAGFVPVAQGGATAYWSAGT